MKQFLQKHPKQEDIHPNQDNQVVIFYVYLILNTVDILAFCKCVIYVQLHKLVLRSPPECTSIISPSPTSLFVSCRSVLSLLSLLHYRPCTVLTHNPWSYEQRRLRFWGGIPGLGSRSPDNDILQLALMNPGFSTNQLQAFYFLEYAHKLIQPFNLAGLDP